MNAHDIVDRLSLIKDAGTINRFREASRIVDVGHKAVYAALENGGCKGMTETEIGGIAALCDAQGRQRVGMVLHGRQRDRQRLPHGTGRRGLHARLPRAELQPGEPLMVDIHAMFKLGLGDHSHNYLIGTATERQKWHAQNFVDIVSLTLQDLPGRDHRPRGSPTR